MTEIQEGAQSDSIKGYKLPVTDTQKEKRNFPGFEKKQWYSLDELRTGDMSGTTDTDDETDNKTHGPGPYGNSAYSKINRKQGQGMRSFKTSSPRKKDN